MENIAAARAQRQSKGSVRQLKNGSTGWTTDPAARLRAHQSGRGAKYTRARGAGGFAYLELCADKRAALRREYALKQLPKAQKELLCAAWTAAGGPFSGA